MKIKSTDPMVLAVAHYYGFKTVGKFRNWLRAIPGPRKLYYHDKDSKELMHTRVETLLHKLY